MFSMYFVLSSLASIKGERWGWESNAVGHEKKEGESYMQEIPRNRTAADDSAVVSRETEQERTSAVSWGLLCTEYKEVGSHRISGLFPFSYLSTD